MQSDDLARPQQRMAQAAFERMMREEVAPDLRGSGFRGTYQLFKYVSGGFAIGCVSWRKSRHSNKEQVHFDLYVMAAFVFSEALFALMPAAQLPDSGWWTVRADQPTRPIADRVVTAVRDYAIPAIAASEEANQVRPSATGWVRTFPPVPRMYADVSDGGGIDPASRFVRPFGTGADRWFADLASDLARDRYFAAEGIADAGTADPRVLPALLDRLEHDPCRDVRYLVARTLLPSFAEDPTGRASAARRSRRRPQRRSPVRRHIRAARDRQRAQTSLRISLSESVRC